MTLIQPLESDPKARNWAMAVHLSSFSIFLGLPFFHLIGPFLIWLVHKDKYPFVDRHGLQAINFQIFISLLFFPLVILFLFRVSVWVIGPLLVSILIFSVINILRAAFFAHKGLKFKYPNPIKFFS